MDRSEIENEIKKIMDADKPKAKLSDAELSEHAPLSAEDASSVRRLSNNLGNQTTLKRKTTN